MTVRNRRTFRRDSGRTLGVVPGEAAVWTLQMGINTSTTALSDATFAPGPDDPTITNSTLINKVGDIVEIQWEITMAATGTVATQVTVDVYDQADVGLTTPLAAQQVFNTGIGLGAVFTVNFAGLDSMMGTTPVTFVIDVNPT